MSGSEHGSTLASSVVAGVRQIISATVAIVAKQDAYPTFPVRGPSGLELAALGRRENQRPGYRQRRPLSRWR
jgi:hypothetical protein